MSAASPAKAIGILGGSFDPVHRAHLALAEAFASELQLDEVRFVPAGHPWQRPALTANAEQRVAMLKFGIAGLPAGRCRFVVDERELHRAGPSYTIATLAAMRGEIGPEASLILLIGADQLLRLNTWKRWRELWNYAHIAAATRPGACVGSMPSAVEEEWWKRRVDRGEGERLRSSPCGLAYLLEDLAIDVSATQIRARLAAEEIGKQDDTLAALLPNAVWEYIRSRGLYRAVRR